MTSPQLQILEDLDVFTPLGVRFWDPALDRAIIDGLTVTAWPFHAPNQQTVATPNRSGVHVFRWLPGMRAVEHRYADPLFFDASTPKRRSFVVTVEDSLERFLPAAFRVDLPLPYPGVFLSDSVASIPGGSPRGVYLFSAPTRRTDERLTAVRGTLVDADSRAPIAWAYVDVAVPHGTVIRGVADSGGRFAVLLPVPSLEDGFAGSPGSFGHGTPIGERGWDITLSASSQPTVLTSLPGTTLPEYRSIFDQLPAELWSAVPNPSDSPEQRLSLRLLFGQQLTVRTQTLSEQLMTAAPGSP